MAEPHAQAPEKYALFYGESNCCSGLFKEAMQKLGYVFREMRNVDEAVDFQTGPGGGKEVVILMSGEHWSGDIMRFVQFMPVISYGDGMTPTAFLPQGARPHAVKYDGVDLNQLQADIKEASRQQAMRKDSVKKPAQPSPQVHHPESWPIADEQIMHLRK